MNNESGRATPEFKQGVFDKVCDWFGEEDKFEPMFTWYDEGTAYVCVKTKSPRGLIGTKKPCDWVTTLYFFRLWEMCGIMEISQDRKVEL